MEGKWFHVSCTSVSSRGTGLVSLTPTRNGQVFPPQTGLNLISGVKEWVKIRKNIQVVCCSSCRDLNLARGDDANVEPPWPQLRRTWFITFEEELLGHLLKLQPREIFIVIGVQRNPSKVDANVASLLVLLQPGEWQATCSKDPIAC